MLHSNDEIFKNCTAIALLDLPKLLLKQHKIKISYCHLRELAARGVLSTITRDGKQCALGELNCIAGVVRVYLS